MSTSRRTFTPEHKREAVHLAGDPGNGNPRGEEVARLKRELRRAREENEILKKPSVSPAHALSEVPHRGRAPRGVRAMCEALAVSPSGYYACPPVLPSSLPSPFPFFHPVVRPASPGCL